MSQVKRKVRGVRGPSRGTAGADALSDPLADPLEAPVQRAASGSAERSPVRIDDGGGSALSVDTRSKMEGGFSQDFSSVKVHKGSTAAADLGAHAFTRGDHVHFAPGAYSDRTLGHELAHVVQQRSGSVAPTGRVGGVPVNEDRGLEVAADRAADRVVSGGSVAPSVNGGGGGGAVQMMRAGDVVDGRWYVITKEDALVWLVSHSRGQYNFAPGPDAAADRTITNAALFQPAPAAAAAMDTDAPTSSSSSSSAAAGPGPTVAQLILQVGDELGIREPNFLALVADLEAEEVAMAASIRGMIKKYLANWTEFTACFATAARLFALLSNSDSNAAEGAATRNDSASVDATARALAHELDAAARAGGGVFSVRYGIHGFTLIARGNRVEILQSFAGGAGESLASSARADNSWDLATAQALVLAALTGNADAQQTMFGGGIEDDANRHPDVVFNWQARGLAAADELLRRVRQKMEKNYALVKGV